MSVRLIDVRILFEKFYSVKRYNVIPLKIFICEYTLYKMWEYYIPESSLKNFQDLNYYTSMRECHLQLNSYYQDCKEYMDYSDAFSSWRFEFLAKYVCF